MLSAADVVRFHEAWADAVGDAAIAERAWHLPLRRALWLWSITWCAKWRVLSAQSRRPEDGAGEDGSAELSDRRLVAHVRDRVDHYLGPRGIAFVREEFAALADSLGEPAP